ncbi:MAG: flagellar biosynthesis protein FlhF [Stagnimonas sp.]|nr:flagellar biosynthesis protein FlhF [Stagnimonas sp.]
MKIKRFNAPTMRDAMNQVRTTLSADAVILESRRTATGVEVVAAVDYDHLAPQTDADIPSEQPVATAARNTFELRLQDDPELIALKRDVQDVKRLLQEQLGGLMWNQTKNTQPQRAQLFSRLSQLGLSATLSRELVAALTPDFEGERADNAVLSDLAQRIPVLSNEALTEGGVIALVGPTGVGKTTTIAKLAARYAAHFGTRDIALVSTDHYRIGAQEQLFTYGRLLGVPVHTARDGAELEALLLKLADRKLVLIDTAGMGPQDRQLAAQLSLFRPLAGKLRTYLAMTASGQSSDYEQTIAQFRAVPLAGCILTKLDEATRIGAALSAVIQHQLGIAYLTDGQRVPEDLQLPRGDTLVRRAIALGQQWSDRPEDDELARRLADATTAATRSHHAGAAHAAV